MHKSKRFFNYWLFIFLIFSSIKTAAYSRCRTDWCMINHPELSNIPANDISKKNKQVVLSYLKALKKFDHEKMKSFIHPSMVFPDTVMKGYREFEKMMNTKWKYKITKIKEDSVFVTMSESNFFYDCIGTGKRTQEVVYLVKDNLIFKSITISMRPSREIYLTAMNKFIDWIKQKPSIDDRHVLNKDNIVFNESSALVLRPLLIEWREMQKTNSSATH